LAKEKELKEKMSQLGVPEEKLYTLDSLGKIELRNEKDRKKAQNSYFGWDGKNKVFLKIFFCYMKFIYLIFLSNFSFQF